MSHGRLFNGPVERWSDMAGFRALCGDTRINTILVTKVDHIGDFILAFDAILALKDAFPDARMELLCAPWNEGLARSLGLFDDIHTIAFFSARADGEHPADRDALLKFLPRGHYDLAIDLRVDADTRMLLRHISATYRVGFESETENDILNVCLPHYLPGQYTANIGMHQTMLMLRLARTAADLFNRGDGVKHLLLDRVAEPCDLDLSPAQGRVLVVCNTSSGRAAKNWPAERFHRLIRWLAVDMDVAVLLIGGKDQAAEAADILQFCGTPNVISAAGKTTLGQAVGLVGQAGIFVGNDSGMTHVAARLDIPTVVLMSGIDPTVMWAASGRHVTILRAPVPCSPCHILSLDDCRGQHACMLNLTEPNVRAVLRNLLLVADRFGAGHGVPAMLSAPSRLIA